MTTVTILSIEPSGPDYVVTFKCVPSGTYTTGVGGDTLNFPAALQDPKFLGEAAVIPAYGAPIQIMVWSANGNIANQYAAKLGTTLANCSLVYGSTTFGSEQGTGAYAPSHLADTIIGQVIVHRL